MLQNLQSALPRKCQQILASISAIHGHHQELLLEGPKIQNPKTKIRDMFKFRAAQSGFLGVPKIQNPTRSGKGQGLHFLGQGQK